MPALAVSTADFPVQNVVAVVVIVAVGNADIPICVTAEVDLQPPAYVTSTVYAPAAVAEYVEAVPTCVVPLNHLYETPELAVRTAELPSQIDDTGAVIVGVDGVDRLIDVTDEVALQPLAFVTSTV